MGADEHSSRPRPEGRRWYLQLLCLVSIGAGESSCLAHGGGRGPPSPAHSPAGGTSALRPAGGGPEPLVPPSTRVVRCHWLPLASPLSVFQSSVPVVTERF